MRKKSTHNRRQGRRAGIVATFAALISMLVASLGIVSAQAADQTKTAWIPLNCSIMAFSTVIPAHVGAELTATFPGSVTPGQDFNLTNVKTVVVFPPGSQGAAGAFSADFVQGIVSEFWSKTTNATTAFATTTGGNPVNSTPNLFNTVGAVQPPNQPASTPEVNGGDTRAGFPGGTPAESFSFGDVPVDTTAGSGSAYGFAPGNGGSFGLPVGGTAVALPPVGPIHAGASGNVTIVSADGPGGNAAVNKIAFHNKDSGLWTNSPNQPPGPITANCKIDTTSSAVPSPDASFVSSFVIPITAVQNGVGSASARGTDPDATFGVSGNPLAAQFSAITDCDAAQSTRPFIVRWESFTFKKTGAATTSSCFSSGGANVNEGTGTGTVNGTPGATVSWHFADGGGPDDAQITVTTTDSGALNIAESPPQPLNGTPGGVWVRGTLPWPAGGGT